METASCLAKKAKSIVAVGMERTPFERVLGLQIGQSMQRVCATAFTCASTPYLHLRLHLYLYLYLNHSAAV
jgi:hypothetical protein